MPDSTLTLPPVNPAEALALAQQTLGTLQQAYQDEQTAAQQAIASAKQAAADAQHHAQQHDKLHTLLQTYLQSIAGIFGGTMPATPAELPGTTPHVPVVTLASQAPAGNSQPPAPESFAFVSSLRTIPPAK